MHATIMPAGYDTSTASIAWALYLISIHPHIQQRIAAELDALGLLRTAARPQPRALDWEDLSQLSYLRNLIKVHCTLGVTKCQLEAVRSSISTATGALQSNSTTIPWHHEIPLYFSMRFASTFVSAFKCHGAWALLDKVLPLVGLLKWFYPLVCALLAP